MAESKPIREAYLMCCIVDVDSVERLPHRVRHCLEPTRFRRIAALSMKVTYRTKYGLCSRWLVPFQHVNAKMVRWGTLAPFRFGLITATQEELRRFLSVTYVRLVAALEEVRDCVEFGVRALRAKDRAQIESLARIIHGQLSPPSLGWMRAKAEQLPITVLDRTYLVEKSQLRKFRHQLKALGKSIAGRAELKGTGPLPPSLFALSVLRRTEPDIVEKARRLLGLPSLATRSEIAVAYRELVRRCRSNRDEEAAATYRRLTASYRTLTAYWEQTGCAREHPLSLSLRASLGAARA